MPPIKLIGKYETNFITLLSDSRLVGDKTKQKDLIDHLNFKSGETYVGLEASEFGKKLVKTLLQRGRYEELLELCKLLLEEYDGTRRKNDVIKIERNLEKVQPEPEPEPNPEADETIGEILKKLQAGLGGWSTNEDINAIINRNNTTNNEHISKFFDGSEPSWIEASSEDVYQREYVKQITDEINSVKSSIPKVILIHGGGGEGKSTVLMQAIAQIVSQPDTHILWRDEIDRAIPQEYLKDRINEGKKMVLASDEAGMMIESVFRLVQNLNQRGQGNVVFILCMRSTDWNASSISPSQWDLISDFKEITISASDIDSMEAEKIAERWMRYDDTSDINYGKELINAIRDYKNTDISDGSFLGAMLQVRKGKNFGAFVQKILDNLEKMTVEIRGYEGTINLLDVFVLIITTHADGYNILTKAILAEFFGISVKDFDIDVRPALAGESAIDVYKVHVFGRHISISKTAKELMATVGHNFADNYVLLVRSTRRAYLKTYGEDSIPDIGKWNRLAYDFIKSDPDLAFRMARAMYEEDPNALFLATLANVCLETNRDSHEQFGREKLQSAEPSIRDSAIYRVWAKYAHKDNDACLEAWLYAISLSNQNVQDELRKHDVRRIQGSLRSLLSSLKILHRHSNEQPYSDGISAISQLVSGLKSRNTKINDDAFHQIFKDLRTCIAYLECYPAGDYQLPLPSALDFSKLRHFLRRKISS